MVHFRAAHEGDLVPALAVYYANTITDGREELPLAPAPSTTLAHILRTGKLFVAEEQGNILAFAGSITRDAITFLTDLFVLPAQQSLRLGQTLLQYVLPTEGIHCTMSSPDPRALALYMRAGMRPHWPHFSLLLANTTQNQLSTSELEVVEAQVNDPALLEWDRRASGRSRPEDHAFWIEQQEGVPLWFKRSGKVVGYGFARLGARMLAYPRVCALGPIGAATEDEASACVLAAVHWASQRAQTMSIEVPGPHPCLLPLLQAGFKIQYADTYMSSAPRPFFDPTRLIASGSDLF